MKSFICMLMLAVASCKAGHESTSYSSGHEGDSGNSGASEYDYTAPSQQSDEAKGGHDFSGAISSFGTQNHGFSGHDFAALQDHGSSGQGHQFSGGQGHHFGGAQQHDFGNSGHDFSLPILQHLNSQFHGYAAPQARGFDVGHDDILSLGGSGHEFQGDSYLKAAHDLGLSYGGQGNGEESEGHSGEAQEEHGGEGQGQKQQEHGFDFPQHGFVLQDGGHEFGNGDEQNAIHDGQNFGYAQAFPVGEHTDEESPVSVPLYKHVTVPYPKTVHISVPKPVLVGVPHPYPVKVPIHKPVAVPVETEISIPVEKVVPYPVVKHVPYPVEKHVPYKVEKTVTVHVPQPYPVKIPVYKTIHHHSKH